MAVPAGAVVVPTTASAGAPPVSLVAYDSIGSSVASNVMSVGFEATSTNEFGDLVQLATGPHALDSVTVEMSAWGCEVGGGTSCGSIAGDTFNHDLTVKIYSATGTQSAPTVGALLASVTKTVAIPFRPSADNVHCTGANAGKWFGGGACRNGFAFPVTFSNFSPANVNLPSEVIWAISYNTSHHGYAPIGNTCVAGSNCAYDSLNVGAETQAGAPLAGRDVDPAAAFVSGTNAVAYCTTPNPPALGLTGVLQNDPGCWTGNTPMAKIVTKPGVYTPTTSVVDVTTVGAGTWNFWQESNPEAVIPATFVTGPATPPIGDGSAHLSVTGTTKATSVRTPQYANTKLSDVQTLSYSVFTTPAGAASTLAFDVNYAGEGTYSGRLVYDPFFSGDAVTSSAWNTLDAMAGKWYASKPSASGGQCLMASPCTWSQILQNWPNAEISGNLVSQLGTGSPAASVDVDNVTVGIAASNGDVNQVTYDFENKCSAICYVSTTGDDTNNGGSAAHPLRHIQTAVTDVNAGGIVAVAAGTYVEDVAVTKAMLIQGAGIDQSIISGAIGGPLTSAFQVQASNVIIDGFTITREGNNAVHWMDANLNSAGVSIQGQTITNTFIRNNKIYGNRTGVDINNSNGNSVVNNLIEDNRTGLILRNQTDNTTVTENVITANFTDGVVFLDASSGSNSPVQSAVNSTFSNNSISGNWYGGVAERQSGGSLPAPGTNLKNFSGNWFGTSTPVVTTAPTGEPGYSLAQLPVIFGGAATAPAAAQPDIAGPASANVDYTPTLTVGTDTNVESTPGQGTIGFQGSHAVLHVLSTGAQTVGSRIDEATHLVTAGGTVNVDDGTYVGPVSIDRSLSLVGTSTAGTIIQGPAASGITLVTTAPLANVTVQKLTITGFVEGVSSPSGTLTGVAFSDVSADHNTGYGIRLLNNVITGLTLARVSASNNGSGDPIGRGLIIQNAVKTDISVTDGRYNDNSLSGIDINDGTVNGLTVSGNEASRNGDEGIGVVGSVGPHATIISDNTVADNGRFGVEVKNSTGDGSASGVGSLVVSGNTISRSAFAAPNATNAAKDYAGISVTRRSPITSAGQPDQPSGAVVTDNMVTGFVRKIAAPNGDGFGIVVEGADNVVDANTVSGNNIGIQIQSANIADQTNPNTPGFDRGSGGTVAVPSMADINDNVLTGNTDVALRNVGAPTTDATCNFFGTASGPAPGDVVGSLTTSPFRLTALLSTPCPFTVPTAPTNVVAVGGNASATVSWTAPASDGGQPVTGYTVTTLPLGGTCTVTGLTASCTGLTNGTSYVLNVAAVNSVGTSTATASNAVTPAAGPPNTASGAPTNVVATAGDGTAALSWTAPASNGGSAITSYTVSPTSGLGTCVVAGISAACSGLTNGSAYTFTVHAVNAIGTGAGGVSNSVTPVATGIGGPPVTVLDFNPAGPRRVFDTRAGQSAGALVSIAKGKVGNGNILTVKLTDLTGLVPATGVGAVSLNVTAVDAAANGFVTVFPCGTQPFVSSVNFTPGTNVANAVIAPVSAAGTVCFFASQPVDLITDVNGWFAAGRAFVPAGPARVLDTRAGLSPDAVVSVPKTPIVGGTVLTAKVTSLAGLTPATGVGTVSLNVTAVDPLADGYLTVYDCGTRADVSSLNFVTGQTVANAVLAPVSAAGTVCFYSSQTTDVVVDINGYLVTPSGFTGVSPKRVFDTRPGFSPTALRTVSTTKVGGDTILEVEVVDLPGAVPATGVGAVSLNVTAVGPSADGYVTVYPCGTRPDSSSVNYATGKTVANAVITPVSATGTVCFFSQNLTDLVVDVNGWFTSIPS